MTHAILVWAQMTLLQHRIQPAHGLDSCIPEPVPGESWSNSASSAASLPEATSMMQSVHESTHEGRVSYNDNVVGGRGCGEGVVDEGLLS